MRSEVVRELSRVRSPLDRLRRATTAAAAAGIGAGALAASSVAGVRGGVPGLWADDGWVVLPVAEPPGGLAPYVAQAGLRPGVVLALVLLSLPFLALAAQAVRVGAVELDRRSASLVLAGASRRDLRRLAARRGSEAFVVGGLAAGPLHLVAWVVLGALPAPGQRLLPVPQWWLVPTWAAVVVGLAALGALLGGYRPDVAVDPVGRSRVAAGPAPRGLVVGAAVGVLVGTAVLGGVLTRSTGGGGRSDWLTPAALLVLLVLVAVLVAALVSRRAAADRGAGRRRLLRPGRGDPAVGLLAAAQRRGDPLAVGTVAGVLLLVGVAVGVAGALGASVEGASFYVTGVLLAAAVAATGALVSLAALALALTDRLLGAGRSVAATAAVGADLRLLVRVQDRALATTAVPAVAGGSALGGLLYAVPPAAVGTGPAAAVVGAVVATVLAGLVVRLACGVLARALTGRVRAAAALENLRTP